MMNEWKIEILSRRVGKKVKVMTGQQHEVKGAFWFFNDET